MTEREEQIHWKLQRLERGDKPRVLDLFSGCGGFSLGFLGAGYDIVGAVEIDQDAIATHARNFFPPLIAPYHNSAQDITTLDPIKFTSKLQDASDPQLAVDVIIGGPPCQAYSRIGRAKLREVARHPEAHIQDPRSDLYLRYLEFVRQLRPLAIVMENVTDILGFDGRNIPEEICETLADLGYECRYTLLNAVHFGVPQMRERLFLVGLASELNVTPSFPEPSHHWQLPRGYLDLRLRAQRQVDPSSPYFVAPTGSNPDLPMAVTAEEALSDLPVITEHLEGVTRQGPERMLNLYPYNPQVAPSRYGKLMREWKGLETNGGVQAHAVRYLPRDYQIFQKMKAGDQYPEAFALANSLFQDELESRRELGEQLSDDSPDFEMLKSKIVPCYDSEKFRNKWRKMEPDEPARTLTAHLGRDCYSHIHYDSEQARVITVREAARLQSFPDGFLLNCSMNSGFKQLGNAVPPLLSRCIAVTLKETLHSAIRTVVDDLMRPLPVVSKHLTCFRPRARLVSILGDQLISDPAVGLIELVKNSYDADAQRVVINILDVTETEKSSVVVQDDGCGMTLEDVLGKWLSPADNYKEDLKERLLRTRLGRLPIGEKGVGRFAVHKLGRTFELVTRASDSPEVVIQLNWDDFDAPENFLDSVAVNVETRDPVVFPGKATGTRLVMHNARTKWTRKHLIKVHRALRRLQSPCPNAALSFQVEFRCPEHPELENLDVGDFLDRSHYRFQLEVRADGGCSYTYHCKHPEVKERQLAGEERLLALAAEELQNVRPDCGPFRLDLYVWQRSRKHLRECGVSPRELDGLCGISMYRDGLRVYPYGEPGNDWLYLDQERIQAPSEKLGNNQVVGLIHLDQEKNLSLRDKTNREGLIENDAFLDLRALVRAGLRLFSSFWRRDRPAEGKSASPPSRTCVESARAIAYSLKRAIGTDEKVRIPGKLTAATNGETNSQNGSSENLELSQADALSELIRNLDGTTDLLRERNNQIEFLQNLAATGMAAERVVNQFGRHVSMAMDSLKGLRSQSKSDQMPEMQALEFTLRSLAEEFRTLAPYGGAGRREMTRSVSVREASQIAFNINSERLRKAKIKCSIEGEDFTIQVRPSSILQVLDNLIDNARYWVSTVDGERRVGIHLSALSQAILVGDTGPGIRAEQAGEIFEPFFTLRNGSKGLGLHLAKELTEAVGGKLHLLEPGRGPQWASGAVFLVSFHPLPLSEQLFLSEIGSC